MTKKPRPPNVTAFPDRWDRTPASYLTGKSYLDPVTELAAKLERHWGYGRLRLLVNEDLRERFDRQRYKLQWAVERGNLEQLLEECRRTDKAYTALDRCAREAGAEPCSITVWEVILDNGTVAALVQDDDGVSDVVAAGRPVAVYTLAEIGKILSAYQGEVNVSLTTKGDPVAAVARKATDPLQDIGHPSDLNDPLDKI